MNIAITGHTSGIGSACINLFSGVGYSRKTGWDITNTESLVKELVEKDYDIVINNAYLENYQSKLLEKLFFEWKNQPKIIISIGSYVIDYPRIEHNKNEEIWPYRDHKKDLAQVFRKLAKQSSTCRLGLINPGPVDTPLIGHLDIEKMHPCKVASMVSLMIEKPYLKEVTLYD